MREMKDSGIEWIGEIPKEWTTTKIKHYCISVFAGGTPQSTNLDYWDGDIKWIPSGSCHDCKIYSAPKTITKMGYENSSTKLIPAHTTLVAMTGATCGNTGFLTFEACANQSVTAYVANTEIADSLFLWYLLQSAKEHLLTFQTGGAQGGINVENCKNIFVPFVPVSEQQKISAYLDTKCTKIDSIIEKQEKVIEKLKAYKLSVITEAVTKGLNPDVKMKDSGVEWIGEIPEHWKVSRIKYVTDFQPFCDTSHLSTDSIITYTPMENIKNGWYIPNTCEYGKLAKSLTQYCNGDIVMAKVTPCFENGNIAIMNNLSNGFGLGSSELFVFRSCNINTKYLFYWLRNNLFIKSACSTMTGTGGLKRISSYFTKNCYIHIPLANEQQQIADYLDKKCSAIDKSIEQKQAIIEKLKEYKKSLIYEVVTGKKEV